MAVLKADICELHRLTQSCLELQRSQAKFYMGPRFLADTLQPMLNIQGLRLILPQAPEELSSSVLSEPCFPFQYHDDRHVIWHLPGLGHVLLRGDSPESEAAVLVSTHQRAVDNR